MGRPGQPGPARRWRGWLLVALAAAGAGARAQAPADPIVGRWISAAGSEVLEIKATGYLRNCFLGQKPGSASMGAWTRTGPGRYRIELTHAITRGCEQTPRTLRRYELSIVGHATASRDELALYVSGEFPPDRFVRAPARPASP